MITPAPGLDELKPVAGNGLLDRRLFLKHGLTLGAAALVAAPARALAGPEAEDPTVLTTGRAPWMREPGRPFSNYGMPSEHERDVVRWISATETAAGNGISWTPLHRLEGIVTPNGLHFERHHNGVPAIDPARHRLMIHGLVQRPLLFSVEDLLRYPMVSHLGFLECGGNSNAGWRETPIQTLAGYFHGLASCSEWTGVPLKVLLREAGLRPEALWLVAEGADAAAVTVSVPVDKALDDALIALYQNGERLRPEQGYPLRLLLPGWEGITNIKWLRRLKAVRKPAMTRDETAKYTELMPDGSARQFTFVMEAKSLITSPSLGYHMQGPGVYQVSGLAWSGRGRIHRVEVSADGGASWAEAHLDEPVLPRCFTRFRIPWRWDGGRAVLQSRATDETGYVQPDRETLVRERGRHGYFHYNAIVSWEVTPEGYLHHVYGDGSAGAGDGWDSWD